MRRVLWLLLVPALLWPTPSFGCTIPVYRYALERWELGTYELRIYHRGPLPKDMQAAIRRWQALETRANFEITTIDLAGEVTPDQRKYAPKGADAVKLPWGVVLLPPAAKADGPVWEGPLTPAVLDAIVDSPARRQLVDRLGRGDSAVFIILESDDAKVNAAVRQTLEAELARLESAIKLPVQSPDGPQLKLPLPLKVKFSVLPVRRDAAGEGPFVRMLLRSEEGLDAVAGPVVLPVFGRGRLLGSLYGKDLTAEQVFDVAKFLCGECSCQVKELNPGQDLLIAADWATVFEALPPEPAAGPTDPPTEPVSIPAPPTAEPAPRVAAAGSESPAVATPPGPPARPWLWFGIGGAGALVVLSALWVIARKP